MSTTHLHQNIRLGITGAAITLSLFAMPVSSAVLVAEYTFDSLDSTDADASSSASAITISGGGAVASSGSTGGFTLTQSAAKYLAVDVLNSESGAETDSDFLGFSVSGTVAGWDELTFDYGASHTGNNAPHLSSLHTSTDGTTFTKVTGSDRSATEDSLTPVTPINLSALAPLSGGTRHFRLYLWASDDASSFETSRFGAVDDIQVTAVPEPASIFLMLGGVLLALAVRRRRG